MSAAGCWRVERGAFKPRGNRWEPFATGSTNRLWRGRGPSGDWLLKWYKHPQPGVHPEPEVGRFLQQRGFDGVPEFGARLDRWAPGGCTTMAYIQRWIPGRAAWDVVLEALRGGASLRGWAAELGRRIGTLHAALASGDTSSSPAFCVTEYALPHHQQWISRVNAVAERLYAALQAPPPQGMVCSVWEKVRGVWLAGEGRWRERIQSLQSLEAGGSCSRIHGDLHLGQILQTDSPDPGSRWWVVDFEGEPLRPLEQRRALELPLRDVAGMWRSFDYAAAVAGVPPAAAVPLQEAFLEGWAGRMPPLEGDWRGLLGALIWEKSIYEALYEIEHRPDWLWVPLRTLA
jgi:predicted trehalose synthase